VDGVLYFTGGDRPPAIGRASAQFLGDVIRGNAAPVQGTGGAEQSAMDARARGGAVGQHGASPVGEWGHSWAERFVC
jgi:hypothetical protein